MAPLMSYTGQLFGQNQRRDITMQSIFQQSRSGRSANAQLPSDHADISDLPHHLLRSRRANLPEVSELQAIRHFTRLSQLNFAIDAQLYPLGSCTMKYNPCGVRRAVTNKAFLNRHPLMPASDSQAYLACLYELQLYLAGMMGMRET